MSGTIYVIIDVYNKEKRFSLKGLEKCGYCSDCKNVPKFIIEKIVHSASGYDSSIHKLCYKASSVFLLTNSKLLVSNNMAKKLKNSLDKKDVSKYKKICSYI